MPVPIILQGTAVTRKTLALVTLACLGLSACAALPDTRCPPPGPPSGGPGPGGHGPGRGPEHGPGPRHAPDPAFAEALAACARELDLPLPPAPGIDDGGADDAPPPRLQPEQRERLHACLEAQGIDPPPGGPRPRD